MGVEVVRGLENVITGQTKISFIDGKKGVLLYRGYDIRDISKHCSFEETSYLLVYGKLPNKQQLSVFRKKLAQRRELPSKLEHIMTDLCSSLLPIDALRSMVSLMKCYDPAKGREREANILRGIDLIAKFPTIVAYYYRTNKGLKIVHPNPGMGHAENFLYMLTGKKPSANEVRIVDLDMTLHGEHGFNASTFSARVTISTLSDMYAAITSAVGTLEGPLHGGAASRVVKMLDEIGSVKNVKGYVSTCKKEHKRIMGFGHRVYKTLDPRVVVIRGLAEKLERRGGRDYYKILRELEKEMESQGLYKKGIYPNVDLYSGTVYKSLGLPEVLFDPMFALGRISGWVSHVLEQLDDNRLIRPRAAYVGKKNLKFVPLEKRK